MLRGLFLGVGCHIKLFTHAPNIVCIKKPSQVEQGRQSGIARMTECLVLT